jgi:urease accessory protein
VSATTRWRVLQIADSGFPVGGFAHSAGLEAMVAHGWPATIEQFEAYTASYVWNVGHSSLPFVAAAYDAPGEIAAVDARFDAFLSNHVANRASRTQGRAFVSTCAQAFGGPEIRRLAEAVRSSRAIRAHYAPVFGAAMAMLGVGRHDAGGLHLHCALRGLLSAAVRLSVVGPHEAARLYDRRAATLEAAVAKGMALTVDEAANVVPLLDVVWANHDALYARLFQS